MNAAEKSIARVRAVVQRLDTSSFPLETEILCNETQICVFMTVPDRTTGIRRRITMSHAIPTHLDRFEDVCRFVFKCVLSIAEHELAECFLVAGERVLDPHKEAA